MRLLMLGSTGSGKSTFARTLAGRVGCAYIELDALNWDPNWTNLSLADPEKLAGRVRAAIAPDAWTCDGNYSVVRPLILSRATHVVWLDYARPVIMGRVIRRSFTRALTNDELWPGTGNREDFRRWLAPEHPTRWAWDTYHAKRPGYQALFDAPEYAHIDRRRVRHPREAARLMDSLAAEAFPI